MSPAQTPASVPGGSVSARRKLAFTALFLIELWERFGYYGMTAVVVLFMVQQLGYVDERASLTFGAFAMMVYAVPSIGGWLGDRILGSRRMTVFGALVLAAGYSCLAIPSSALLFPALGVIAVGNGLFKANPANLVSKVYEGEASQIDSAFTMYYMAVNLGAAISQIATPLIAVAVGWHVAFAVCAAGLLVGVVNYFVMRRHLAHVGSEPDFQPFNWGRFLAVLAGGAGAALAITAVVQNLSVAYTVLWLACGALVVIFAIMIRSGTRAERRGLLAVLLLTAQCVLFFIFYQQMPTSLTLFALRNVDLTLIDAHVFGAHVFYSVPPGQVQALNPIWIFILSPLLAMLYTRLSRGRGDLSVAAKYAWGFAFLSLGFFTYGLSGVTAVAGRVSVWWMVGGYGLQSLAELLISGLGLAMVARYVGPRLRGFIMGVWFLATGISQFAGSWVASLASVPHNVTDPVRTLPLYSHLFNALGGVAVLGTIAAFAMLPLFRRLSVQEAEPGLTVPAPPLETEAEAERR
jgi:proton-dependent oligopeptide transporter, POT family